jgi:hypothetical protein
VRSQKAVTRKSLAVKVFHQAKTERNRSAPLHPVEQGLSS